MPHWGEEIVGREAIVREVGFNWMSGTAEQQVPEEARRARWEHSSFADPGEDWNILHIYDAKGKEIRSFFQQGY